MIMVGWLLDHILIVGACVVATDDVGEENGLVGTGSVFFVGAVFVGVAVGGLAQGRVRRRRIVFVHRCVFELFVECKYVYVYI